MIDLHAGLRRIHHLGEIADYMPRIMAAHQRLLDDR
mgnify:CR=1 FL=1|tara:strand:+ start:209 stop:316 length:108 start_codon:yes stop_codon:yes gene_type:complete